MLCCHRDFITATLGMLPFHYRFASTLVVLLAFHIVHPSQSAGAPWRPVDCPTQCICQAENSLRKVYCDIQDKQRDLTAVPARFPKDTQFISLSRNKIATIPVGAFAGLTELRYLVLSHNELQSLHRDVFRGLKNLTSLNVANNNLSILPSGLLSGLPSLRDLYLDGNLLQNLPKDFLSGLTALRRLLLNNNKFQTFSEQVFGLGDERFSAGRTVYTTTTKSTTTTTITPTTLDSLPRFDSLVELRLNHNGIGQVKDGSFNRMSDLKQLKLNDNNISTLPRGLFRQLKSLQLVSLYNNPFQCTCALKWLKHWILHNDKKITVFHQDRIRCNGPPGVQGRPLIDLRDEDFGCLLRKQWSTWSNWSACSKSCGGGRQSRMKNCTRDAHGLECQESSRQWQACNTQTCEHDLSEWSTWTECSVSCSLGRQSRNRGTRCTQTPCTRKFESVLRVCYRGPCPTFSQWSPWSQCDRVCGMGAQTRTRTCLNDEGIGQSCSGSYIDTRECKDRDCSEWTQWGLWSSCNTTCGSGSQNRTRRCIKLAGSKVPCKGDGTERRSCDHGECPVHGGWSSWSPWSSCNQKCGLGLNRRNRACTNPAPRHGGAPCNGSTVTVVSCVHRKCMDDESSEFTAWSSWSECSTQCGQGTQRRSRRCTKLDPVSGVGMCLRKDQEYQMCDQYTHCHSTGTWGPWSAWSECFGNCNQGLKLRFRFCVGTHGQIGRLYTCGSSNQTFEYERTRHCKPTSCSHNPVWSTWSNWSVCSKSCARGTRRRNRFCLTKVIRQMCPGHYESKEACNLQPCPIDGGWSEWSDWGNCSTQCGGGLRTRNRTCTNPDPQYEGHDCVGGRLEQKICNKQQCKDYVVGDETTSTSIMLMPHKECPKPEKPKHGRFIIKKQRDDNTFLEYKCDPYYRNKRESTNRFCLPSGKWTGEDAECVPDCGEIGNNASPDKRLMKDDNIMYMNESWPWQVAIRLEGGFKCGGSLISKEWIVTAAHCVLESKQTTVHKSITIYLGTNSLNEEDHSLPGVQIIPVEKVIYHQRYNWNDYSHDIALLKLKRNVQITSTVHPICLPKKERRKNLVAEGALGVVVGWGGGSFLRQIPLPVVSLKECKDKYPKYQVTKEMLCAGYRDSNRDTCKRDSGGGFLFLDNYRNKSRWFLGGIVSWGHPNCGVTGKYSVFTSVVKLLHWVRKQIRDNS